MILILKFLNLKAIKIYYKGYNIDILKKDFI